MEKSGRYVQKTQPYFILVNKRFGNGVKQARTYPGADVGSDHNPLMIEMNIKLKKA